MTAPFTLPSVHLNGTSRQTLLTDYNNAYHKLLEFRDAFAAIEFNARDYYVQSPDAFSRAREQRDAAFSHVAALTVYLEAHLLHLAP